VRGVHVTRPLTEPGDLPVVVVRHKTLCGPAPPGALVIAHCAASGLTFRARPARHLPNMDRPTGRQGTRKPADMTHHEKKEKLRPNRAAHHDHVIPAWVKSGRLSPVRKKLEVHELRPAHKGDFRICDCAGTRKLLIHPSGGLGNNHTPGLLGERLLHAPILGRTAPHLRQTTAGRRAGITALRLEHRDQGRISALTWGRWPDLNTNLVESMSPKACPR